MHKQTTISGGGGRESGGRTPIWAAFCFTFTSSLGTGLVTNGVSFVGKNAFHFTQRENYILAVMIGITYIAAAAGLGPVLSRLKNFITERTVLIFVMLGCAICTALPSIPVALGEKWPVWVMAGVYTPLTGILWPLVESYVSGGRLGDDLRATLSRWNVVWSGAVAVSMWAAAPLIEKQAPLALLCVGVFHLLSIGLLFAFPARVPKHLHEDHASTVPLTYRDLLTTFRILLPASYVVTSALTPHLPDAFTKLQVPAAWHTVMASAWLFPRVIAFWAHDHTHAWRGHWWHPVAGGLLILSGFGLAVFAPWFGPGAAGISAMVLGLAALGTGMACIYSGAIYYVMAVHASEVEAGGSHESLVGVGYLVGPLFGLLATVGVEKSILNERSFEPLVMGMVAFVAVFAVAIVIWRVRRQHRDSFVVTGDKTGKLSN